MGWKHCPCSQTTQSYGVPKKQAIYHGNWGGKSGPKVKFCTRDLGELQSLPTPTPIIIFDPTVGIPDHRVIYGVPHKL